MKKDTKYCSAGKPWFHLASVNINILFYMSLMLILQSTGKCWAQVSVRNIAVKPSVVTMSTDDTLDLSLLAYSNDSESWDITFSENTLWTTNDMNSIVCNGKYSPSRTGTYEVWAIAYGLLNKCHVQVIQGKTTRFEVEPKSAVITMDDILQIKIKAFDADGNWHYVNNYKSCTWATSDPEKPEIYDGIYVPGTMGTYYVIMNYNGQRDTCRVSVTHGTVAGLEITPSQRYLIKDESLIDLCARAYDAFGNGWDVTNSVYTEWNNPGSLQPITNGNYSADIIGNHTIHASYAGYSASCTVKTIHGKMDNNVSPYTTALVSGSGVE